MLAAAASKTQSKKGAQPAKQVDDDPDGEKLIHISDPLEQASKFSKLLQDHSADALETHSLAFEIYFRKKKILLAFRAVKRQLKLDPDNPIVHRNLILFFDMVDHLPEAGTPAEKLVHSVIAVERKSLTVLGSKPLLDVNKAFLETHKDSLQHRAAAAEILFLLSPGSKAEAIKIIEESENGVVPSGGAIAKGVGSWQLKDCLAVDKLLAQTFSDSEAAGRWRTRIAEFFPYSTHFKGPKSAVASAQ